MIVMARPEDAHDSAATRTPRRLQETGLGQRVGAARSASPWLRCPGRWEIAAVGWSTPWTPYPGSSCRRDCRPAGSRYQHS